jgi:hypothetical protein
MAKPELQERNGHEYRLQKGNLSNNFDKRHGSEIKKIYFIVNLMTLNLKKKDVTLNKKITKI